MTTHHSLEKSETSGAEVAKPDGRWLVLINHHEARIFKSAVPGAVSEQILPHDAEHFFRHAHNSKDFARGREKPDPNSYFEPIAKALSGADQLLVFGSGSGMANEMDQFVAWLKVHHQVLAQRIIGSLIVDEHHMTDAQLLAKARDFYAAPHLPAPPTQ